MATVRLHLLLVVCCIAFVSVRCRPSYPAYIALPSGAVTSVSDGHGIATTYIQVHPGHPPVLIDTSGLISTAVFNAGSSENTQKSESATESPEDESSTDNVEENSNDGADESNNSDDGSDNGQYSTENSNNGQYSSDGSDDGQYRPESAENDDEGAENGSDNGQYKPENGENDSDNGQYKPENGETDGSDNGQYKPDSADNDGVSSDNNVVDTQEEIAVNLVNAAPWLVHGAPISQAVISSAPTTIASQSSTVVHSAAFIPAYAPGYPRYVAIPYGW